MRAVQLLEQAAVYGKAAHRDPHYQYCPPVHPVRQDSEDEERAESSHDPEARAKNVQPDSTVDGRRRQSEQLFESKPQPSESPDSNGRRWRRRRDAVPTTTSTA